MPADGPLALALPTASTAASSRASKPASSSWCTTRTCATATSEACAVDHCGLATSCELLTKCGCYWEVVMASLPHDCPVYLLPSAAELTVWGKPAHYLLPPGTLPTCHKSCCTPSHHNSGCRHKQTLHQDDVCKDDKLPSKNGIPIAVPVLV